jgi:small-conductance mechanosensitive channel
MPWEAEFWTEHMRELLVTDVMRWLPMLAAALLLLVFGWLAARLAQFVVGGILKRIGLDRLGEKAGGARLLQDLGMDSSVSRVLARLVFWLILLVFVLAAADSLGLQGMSATLQGVVDYLPKVLAAMLILLLGGLIARLVGNTLGALADRSGIRGGLALGQATRYIILIFVVVLALEQLGVETALLVSFAIVLVTALMLALALAFGWGSRELARSIMAGFHLREVFVVGQILEVRGHRGRLTAIGPVKTMLETEKGRVSLPNSVFTEEEVVILPDEGNEGS